MMSRISVMVLLMMCCVHALLAEDIGGMRHKRKLLKGQWQLVKTFNQGVAHAVAKEEYDAVVTLRSCGRYKEEVRYEGYHWIIKGKWKVYRHKNALDLTKLKYVLGAPPGGQPQDIHFTLYQLDKTHWGGNTETKAEKVKMEYQHISAK